VDHRTKKVSPYGGRLIIVRSPRMRGVFPVSVSVHVTEAEYAGVRGAFGSRGGHILGAAICLGAGREEKY